MKVEGYRQHPPTRSRLTGGFLLGGDRVQGARVEAHHGPEVAQDGQHDGGPDDDAGRPDAPPDGGDAVAGRRFIPCPHPPVAVLALAALCSSRARCLALWGSGWSAEGRQSSASWRVMCGWRHHLLGEGLASDTALRCRVTHSRCRGVPVAQDNQGLWGGDSQRNRTGLARS